MNKRGYFGIGIYKSKTKANYETLCRSAYGFGASFIFMIGARYKKQNSDTSVTFEHIPIFNYKTFDEMYLNIPVDCKLIGMVRLSQAENLQSYNHPERAIYLLAGEDYGLPPVIHNQCHSLLNIQSRICLNVATTWSIVMHDRMSKGMPFY